LKDSNQDVNEKLYEMSKTKYFGGGSGRGGSGRGGNNYRGGMFMKEIILIFFMKIFDLFRTRSKRWWWKSKRK